MRLLFLFILIFNFGLTAQRPELFTLLQFYNGENVESAGFVSFSEIYRLSDDPDSSATPFMENYNESDLLKLEGVYRERFLKGTKLSESDHLFIYDYSTNDLIDLNVKDLIVVACPNPYIVDVATYSQEDFMIGLRIPVNYLKGLSDGYQYCFVAAGKENPFVKGQMKPVKWRKTKSLSKLPLEELKSEGRYISADQFSLGDAYEYRSDGLIYFVQQIVLREGISGETYQAGDVMTIFLKISHQKTNQLISQRFIFTGESSSPAPLNDLDKNDKQKYQWQGMLLKDQPPVIFRLELDAYGCPALIPGEKSAEDIYINCDNRH